MLFARQVAHTPESFRRLFQIAEAQGFVIERTTSHWRIKAPTGELAHTSSSPSDRRAVHNLRSLLRRMGLKGV